MKRRPSPLTYHIHHSRKKDTNREQQRVIFFFVQTNCFYYLATSQLKRYREATGLFGVLSKKNLIRCLVEVTQNLTTSVAATGLLVVHDTGRGGQDDVTELAGRQETGNPLLELVQLDVETGGDDTGLVDASDELDNDLAGAVVINLLKLTDVA